MPAAALIAWVTGIVVLQQQAHLPAPGLLAAIVVMVPMLTLVAWRWRDQRRTAALALCAAAAAAGFAYAAMQASLRLADQLARADEGRDLRLTGVIAGLPARTEHGWRFEFVVETVTPAAVHVPRKLSLSWYARERELRSGERWDFTARLRRPRGTLNPGGFDLEGWLLERNLRAGGYVRETREPPPQRLDAMVWTPAGIVDRARDELRRRLSAQLQQHRYGGVLLALVLGDQRAINEADWQLFNRSGIAHLMSISGLHITMIAGLIAVLTRWLWSRSRRALNLAPSQTAAAAAGMLAALAYCLLAGWGVPAQRTFFMLAIVAAALWLRLGTRPLTTLALAAAGVTLLDPWAVIAPGFWLSFGAVASILFVLHGRAHAPGQRDWRHTLRDAAQAQLAVTVALMPLTIVLFQQASLVSPLANAVAIPLVSLVVTPLALIAGVSVALPAPLSSFAVPCLALADSLVGWLVNGLSLLTVYPWANLSLPSPPPWLLPLIVAGVLWLLAPPGWPQRWLGLLWLTPLWLWPAQRPAADELWITALDVGQGGAVLVETTTHRLLYDTGPRYSSQSDAGGRIIVPYLRWRGIDRLDLLVVSHQDGDHAGGAAAVQRQIAVDRVLGSIAPQVRAQASPPMVHPAAFPGQETRCIEGQQFVLGTMRAAVLRPQAADYSKPGLSPNALSCVMLVSLGAQRLLLSGDISAVEESELISRDPLLRARLLAVPHHGSRFSTSERLLDGVQPEFAFVQAGYRNRFGHPHPDVLARLAARGIRTARTDLAGALQWRLRGDGSVQMHAWREQARRYWHDNHEAQDTIAAQTRPFEPGLRGNAAATAGQESLFQRDVDLGAEPIDPH